MCTRDEGARIRETYAKYKEEREIEIDDLRFLEILADSLRVHFSIRDGKVYAQSVW